MNYEDSVRWCNMTAVIAIVGTICGIILGFILGKIRR